MLQNGSSHWAEVPIGEILNYLDDQVVFDDMAEYVTITVKRRHGGLEPREKLFGHEIKTKKQYRLHRGTFIISRVQCWHAAFAIVPDDIPENMIASQNYDQFEISPKVDKRFFWWLSHSPQFIETVRSSASGVVIEKMVFNRDSWLQKTIPLPPLIEQHQIVERIESLATRVNEAERLREEAEIEADALFGSAVSNIPFDKKFWTNVDFALSKHKGAIHSGPFGSDLTHDEFVEFGVAAIGTRDVQVNNFSLGSGWYVTPERFERLKQYQIFPHDVLVTIIGGSIGRFCVVPENVPLAFTTKHVIAMQFNPSIAEPQYMSYLLNFHRRCRETMFSQTAGSAQPSLNISKIKAIEIPVPSLDEQRRIVAYLDSVQARLASLRELQSATGEELSALLPSVLDRAFKGEL